MTTPESDPLAALRRELDLLDEWHIVDAAKLAVMRIPDGQLLDFRMWVGNEPERRVKERVAAEVRDETAAQLINQLAESGALELPELVTAANLDTHTPRAWEPAHGNPLLAGRYGEIVEHKGTLWQSLHPGLNMHEPGAFGVTTWMEYTPPEPQPETTDAQPWAPGIVLKPGDLVTHQGKTWRVTMEHTAEPDWAPGSGVDFFEEVTA